ncbi:MAG: hypothetical protein KGD64_06920 [Candidatus Heimdallarchaeota archaeon]|nr:hypothetical protein [Candidatus Heimdallarchaeota archaeon]
MKRSEELLRWIDDIAERFIKMANEIWKFAEIRFEEVKSAKLQIKTLEEEGFVVSRI